MRALGAARLVRPRRLPRPRQCRRPAREFLVPRDLVLIALRAQGSAWAQAESDFATMMCLADLDRDANVEACSRMYPALADQVVNARRKWEVRNAAGLRELKAACETRLLR